MPRPILKKNKKVTFFWWLIFIIFFISILIRLVYLTYPIDMWHDASFTYSFSKESVSFILDSNDVHPPLYYLIMKGFLYISDNEIFLRLTSVLFWCMFFWATLFFVKLNYNENITVIVLTLFSLSPTIIYYSIEPRNYMLGMFFVIMQLYYFFEHLKDGHEGRISWQFILFSLLMLYTHYYTGLLLLVEGLFMLKGKLNRIIATKNYLIITIFSLPLLYYLLFSLTKIQEFWFKDIGLNSLISTIPYQFVQPDSLTSISIIFFCIMICIISFSWFVIIKDRWFAYILFFMPVIIVWLISQSSPMYHHRFFLFFAIGLYLIIAQVINILFKQNKFLQVLGWGLLIFFILLLCSSFDYMRDHPTDDIYKSTKFMKTRFNQTDTIYFIHINTFTQTPYKYYFRDYPNVKHLLLNNLTQKQLFTAGGSIVKPEERINITQLPKHFYYVTDTVNYKYDKDNVIYDKGGLIIWER